MAKNKIAQRVLDIAPSGSIELAAEIEFLRSKGERIISLNVGEPDFNTPERIIKATITALQQGKTRYSLVNGLVELREKIAKQCHQHGRVNLDAENIILGNGSKHILYLIFQTLINPQDEVIINSPYWVTFPESVKLAGGRPVIVSTLKNFQLDLEAIKSKINHKTKAIIVNSPNNPTGAVYPKEDLKKLLDLCHQHDLYLISDEAYEFLSFNRQHCAIGLEDEDSFSRTLTVRSFSKSYAMTGFRIGHLIGPREVISQISKLQGHLSGNNCTFAQYGAIEALNTPQEEMQQLIQILKKRCDFLYQKLLPIFPNLTKPDGAFYIFPSLEQTSYKQTSDVEVARNILRDEKIALLPGSFFGMDKHLRLSFSASDNDLQEAADRLVNHFNKL